MLRMPAELKGRLEAAAASQRRTVTAEIVHRLEQSFAAPAVPGEDFLEVVAQMKRELEELGRRDRELNSPLHQQRLRKALRVNERPRIVKPIRSYKKLD